MDEPEKQLKKRDDTRDRARMLQNHIAVGQELLRGLVSISTSTSSYQYEQLSVVEYSLLEAWEHLQTFINLRERE